MENFTFEKTKYGFEFFKNLKPPKENLDNTFNIFIFERAAGQLELNSRTLKIRDRAVVFESPNQQKKWNLDNKKSKGFRLVFQGNFFSEFFNDKLFPYRLHYFFNALHSQHLQLSAKDFDFVTSILNEISNELKSSDNNRIHSIKSLLSVLFYKFNNLFATKHQLSSETHSDKVIYKFKETLERHIKKFHRVDDYCDILQIQRNKLNRIVKTHFGVTAKETIHLRLLQEIKLELLYSTKTVVQISNDLNFSEPNNMTRFFNRLEGIPPSIFREKSIIN